MPDPKLVIKRRHTLPLLKQTVIWLLLLPGLVQCNTVAPPLPSPPETPALTIAVLSPTAGELAPVGQTMRNAILLAFDMWNERGGAAGRRLQWELYHTDCTFEQAQQATRQAIDDGHDFILGPLCSEAAIAAAVEAAAADVVLIAPTAVHPLVTADHQGMVRSTVFRMSYDLALQGRAAARFARETLDIEQAALIFSASDQYAANLAQGFAQQFIAEGGKIVQRLPYGPGPVDFTGILTRTHQSGAELIYLPDNAATANQIIRRYEELGFSGQSIFLGSDLWQTDNLNRTVTTGSYFPVHFIPDEDNPTVQAWIEQYEAVYAVEPEALAALSYDSANLLATAISQAETVDPVDVARRLEQLEYNGVTGPVTCDPRHHPIKPVPFVQVKEGRLDFVTAIEPRPASPLDEN